MINDVSRLGSWALIKVRLPSEPSNVFISRLMSWRDELSVGLPAHARPIDQFGIGKISILFADGSFEAPIAHTIFQNVEPAALWSALADNIAEQGALVERLHENWMSDRNLLAGHLVRRWLERAAKNGSSIAAERLRSMPAFRVGKSVRISTFPS